MSTSNDLVTRAQIAVRRTFFAPVLFCAVLATVVLSGCAGNGSSSVPNSGAGGASGGGTTGSSGNAILSGKYAFSLTGTATQTGAFIVEAGSFTADGAGNITAGVEDINILATGNSNAAQTKGVAVTGNYSIGADGRGTLNFTSGLTQTYKIAIENGNHGQLTRFDSGASGSGTFDVQTTAAFSVSALQQGAYVFGFNGSDGSGNVLGGVGSINLSGTSASGALDLNDNGSATQATVVASFAAPDSNGHGTATFTYGGASPSTYGYDIISATRLLLIETDANGTVGEADAQSTGLTANSMAGSYVLSAAGESNVGTVALVGQMTLSAGAIASSDVVENIEGAHSGGAFTAGTYNSSNVVGSTTVAGRYTLTATDPALRADGFVAYLISPGKAMVLETDANAFTFGQMLAQTTASYSVTSLSGNYGFGFTGFDDTANGFEGDFVGQITSAGTGTLSAGTLDINYQGLSTPTVPNNSVTVASYAILTPGTGHGTMTFTADGAVFLFHFFFVSPNQIELIETDSLFVSTGSALIQPVIP